MSKIPYTTYFFRPLQCNTPTVARGHLSLLSTSLSALSESITTAHEIAQSTEPAHITLLTKDEHRTYLSNPNRVQYTDIDVSKLYPVGLTHTDNIWFVPVVWNAGNAWRGKNGFSTKDFHITLSEKDDYTIDKSLYTIRGDTLAENLDVEVLDQIYLCSHFRGEDVSRRVGWAERVIEIHPLSERGYLRLADLAYLQEWHKLGMLCYYAALVRCAGDGAEKRREYYKKKIAACGEHTEFGPFFTEEEVTVFNATVNSSLRESLSKPWDSVLELPEIEYSRCTESRTRYHVLYPTATKLPRFFSWVVPFHLAAMSTPRSADDITLLHSIAGITHIITLTSETALPRSWFPPGSGIRNTFIPVKNYHPPTTQQTDRILSLIQAEPSHNPSVPGRTLIHCGGGKGRAGTILSCYLALFGRTPSPTPTPKMPAKPALDLLRRMRVGSVETPAQEQFITSYLTTAWKRHNRNEPLTGTGGTITEPIGEPLVVHGDITDPDMVVLVGLPGAGKTCFALSCRLRNPSITHVSPDTVVSESAVSTAAARTACESVVGRFRKSPIDTPTAKRKVLLLDRCNPTRTERQSWRNLFMGGKIVAVWFDYDHALCIARGENRGDHPTVTPWRVKRVVTSMAGMMEVPTVEEGFSGVVRVRGVDNARELADLWFGSVGIKKFPRTKHLLDLGSATRDDLVIPPQDLPRHFNRPVTIEEKLDGANLAFSLSFSGELLIQNRSHYITPRDQAQFHNLAPWLSKHSTQVRQLLTRDAILPERFVLYGEWLAATHTVTYDRLQDYFLAFDLYDRLNGVFAPADILRGVLAGTEIHAVPVLYRGVLEGEDMLRGFLDTQSAFGEERVEGVVVRWDSGERGKVVRAGFVSGAHWRKGAYRKNQVARESGYCE